MALRLYGNGNIENVDSIVTSASATLSATELGYIDGVTSALQTQLNNAGKILQIVRATDGTRRSTTSTSYVDVSGMSVSITPTKSTSALIIMAAFFGQTNASSGSFPINSYQLADSSNNSLSGSESMQHGLSRYTLTGSSSLSAAVTVWGYVTPATTSSVTYKLRFRTIEATNTAELRNDQSTGQMYAIEVAA